MGFRDRCEQWRWSEHDGALCTAHRVGWHRGADDGTLAFRTYSTRECSTSAYAIDTAYLAPIGSNWSTLPAGTGPSWVQICRVPCAVCSSQAWHHKPSAVYLLRTRRTGRQYLAAPGQVQCRSYTACQSVSREPTPSRDAIYMFPHEQRRSSQTRAWPRQSSRPVRPVRVIF